MLHLEKINHKNVWDIVDLKVFKFQKDFVAPNWASIVQAQRPRHENRCVYVWNL